MMGLLGYQLWSGNAGSKGQLVIMGLYKYA